VIHALLCQQLIILSRQVKRPTCTRTYRVLRLLLARATQRWKQALVIVQPDTLSWLLVYEKRTGSGKSCCLDDWQARDFVAPFGVTDNERHPCLPLLLSWLMVDPLRRPTLAERRKTWVTAAERSGERQLLSILQRQVTALSAAAIRLGGGQ
jgi:hypothetical protein